MNKCEYDVRITAANNGLVVDVGCKKIVVMEAGIDDFLVDLKDLLTNGYEADRRMRVKYLGESFDANLKTACCGETARDVPMPVCN